MRLKSSQTPYDLKENGNLPDLDDSAFRISKVLIVLIRILSWKFGGEKAACNTNITEFVKKLMKTENLK